MTITYEIAFEDLMAFNRHHLRHSTTHQRMRTLVRLIFIPVSAVFVVLRWLEGKDVLVFSLALLVVAIVWYFLYPRLFDRRVEKGVKRMLVEGSNQGLLGAHTFNSTSEGFRITYPGGDSFHKWSGIGKVEHSDEHIFVYTSSVQAIVIPRRSLQGIPFEAVLTEITNHAGSLSQE